MKWTDLVKYQNLIPNMPADVMDTLDTMNELIPIVQKRDRLGTFLQWRGACKDAGIIDGTDIIKINHEFIHGCGGL